MRAFVAIDAPSNVIKHNVVTINAANAHGAQSFMSSENNEYDTTKNKANGNKYPTNAITVSINQLDLYCRQASLNIDFIETPSIMNIFFVRKDT